MNDWLRLNGAVLLALSGCVVSAAEPEKPAAAAEAPPSTWVEKLVEKARPSVVVITVTGRDGTADGTGSGFIISPDGLIATNLHVIGEARPITVRTADGKSYDVKSVEATDRSFDLALVRIDAKGLPALELGDSDKINQGQAVVALGNPHGLEHSVVAGVVSGHREIDGLPLVQLAIPIEPGNSGGPLLDEHGRVLGLLTMKSAVTANLGFAVKINALKPLVKKPNPVPMERWLTIGALAPTEWTTLFGAWRQRAGRITVDGAGQGFGGRSLCLSRLSVPEPPFEVAVSVKLNEESGAAGLVFASDGGDQHYGFYPSAGHLRLSHFKGPDVFSWQVLGEESSPHYRPGDWNALKVRVEPQHVRCWVNDHLIFDVDTEQPLSGSVGLAKFRTTQAEFKGFRIAKEIPASGPSSADLARFHKLVGELSSGDVAEEKLLKQLTTEPAATSLAGLRSEAKLLDERATQLRRLAREIHQRDTLRLLSDALAKPDPQTDLMLAALLVARLDNDELDVAAYQEDFARLRRELQAKLPAKADNAARLAALGRFMFDQQSFHGSRNDYYNRSNSYLNEVLDDREGIPITLSIVYLELARSIGLTVVGVGLPGHFMVRSEPDQGESQLIDVFEGGRVVSRDEAAQRVLRNGDGPLLEEHLATIDKRSIITRMLHNLLGVANREQDAPAMLRYLDAILVVAPEAADERLMRAVLLMRSGRPKQALEDTAWLLDHRPEGIDPDRVLELQQIIENTDK